MHIYKENESKNTNEYKKTQNYCTDYNKPEMLYVR